MNRAISCVIIAQCLACGASLAWAQESALRLVVSHARDADQGFVAREQPLLERRILAWSAGVVSTPDTLAWLAEGDDDLAFVMVADHASAQGVAGTLPLTPGRYDIDTPILLTDGRLVAFLASGRLEVRADRLVYQVPTAPIERGGALYILAGVALATVVLLRALYRRSHRS